MRSGRWVPRRAPRPFSVRTRDDVWKRDHLNSGRFVDRIKEKSRLGRDQIGRLVLILNLGSASEVSGDRHIYYAGPDALAKHESGDYDEGRYVMVFVRLKPFLADGRVILMADDVVLCDRYGQIEVA